MKVKVDQFSLAKNICKKLHSIYSKKHAGQEEDDDDRDSNKVDS